MHEHTSINIIRYCFPSKLQDFGVSMFRPSFINCLKFTIYNNKTIKIYINFGKATAEGSEKQL